MSPIKFLAVLMFLSWSISAQAQTRLSVGELTSQLNQTAGNAQMVGIDVDAIRADIEARIRADGTENAGGSPPISDVLKGLPNFIVQIQFELNSDVITSNSWETVGRIADAMFNPLLAGDRFLIVGNTDARGKREANLNLSDRRAAAVAEMLTNVFRVPANRLVSIGLGEEQLLDTQNPDDGINRRVQLINIGPL